MKRSDLLLLQLFLSGNLLKIRGRIGQSFLPFFPKHQIMLSKNNLLSTLLVQDVHVKKWHSGGDLNLSLIWELLFDCLSKRCCLIGITANAKQFYQTTHNEVITHQKITCIRSSIHSYWHRLSWITVSSA